MRCALPAVLLALAMVGSACGAKGEVAPESKRVLRLHRFRGPEVRCDPDRLVAPDTPAARSQCEAEVGKACLRLLDEEHPRPEDIALAQTKLRALCERDRAAVNSRPADPGSAHDRTCSCGAYGAALSNDRAHEVEGVALLDEACTRGLLDACDLAALIAELCSRQPSPVCDDLAAQGRVRVPGPDEDEFANPATLPPALRRCFLVSRVDACERAPCLPAPAPGTALCFGADRLSFKVPARPWDQAATSWRGWAGVGVYLPSHDHQRVVARDGVVRYGRAVLSPAPESVLREAAALPFAGDVCARARRCAEALEHRAAPTQHGDEPEAESAPVAAFPATLAACLALERALRCD